MAKTLTSAGELISDKELNVHTHTKYKCVDCGAEDQDRGDPAVAPRALICYKCRAGDRYSVDGQLAAGVGMLVVYE